MDLEKNRSTVDHLVRLDTYIRRAFASEKVTVSVFFDLAKAYDTTWRFGILRDMKKLGIGGNMGSYIKEFLSLRKFKVLVGSDLSDEMIQVAGVPQGSILSVTLFAIKINALPQAIPSSVHSSLFVDDIQIAYSDYSMQKVQNVLQPVINNIYKWANSNGFTFSVSKTQCMTFHRNPDFPLKPTLKMNNIPLSVEKTAKFLGLTWDPQLNWNTHIRNLVTACNKPLGLLRSLTSLKWGADQCVMLHVYRLVLRPKIDYGCIIYGSASTALLNRVESLQSEALRITSGAFRSSPVKSLQVLLNETSLEDRRDDLICRYFFRNKCFILNPAYNYTLNPDLITFFSTKHDPDKPLLMRINNALAELHIPTQPVLPYRTPDLYSFQIKRPKIDNEFVTPDTKRIPNFNPTFVNYVRESYAEHHLVYTDGSRDSDGVGSAAVLGQFKLSSTLPTVASIYTAELQALKLACSLICNQITRNPSDKKFLICSDSLSAVQALNSIDPKNHFLYRVQISLHNLITNNLDITVLWIPSHSGIEGNDTADKLAKEASKRLPEFIACPYTDWFSVIKTKMQERWVQRWNTANTQLTKIIAEPTKMKKTKMSRREQVVINRLKIGHTNLTHGYLMNNTVQEPRPTCRWCHVEPMSVEHVLVTCPQLSDVRVDIFGDPNPEIGMMLGDNLDVLSIIEFLNRLDILHEI